MTERKYLPTFAELVDRLSIVQLKMIFISEHRAAYEEERMLIEHDIDLWLKSEQRYFRALDLRAVMMIMLANRVIWDNESKARTAMGNEQDKLLKFTHSINGIRNTAKNVLSVGIGERLDLKVDCLAADLPVEFGNWKDLFG